MDVTSNQWTAIAQKNRDEAASLDPNSATYQALIKAANAATSAAADPGNASKTAMAAQLEIDAIQALDNDSNASATLQSYAGNVSDVLSIPPTQNTNADLDSVIKQLSTVLDTVNSSTYSTYSSGVAEADLVSVMQLFLEFAQEVRKTTRNERKAELDAALSSLNAAADKIHNAALERYKGAIGKAVFEIAGAATTIGSSVYLVKSMNADVEPAPITRGSESDAEFKIRVDRYEGSAAYKAAAKDGTLADYQTQNPPPERFQKHPNADTTKLSKTEDEYRKELANYKDQQGYKDAVASNDAMALQEYEQNNRPKPPAESDDAWEMRARAHKERVDEHIQATSMKQTQLMTYSQLTGAVGQLVSAPGGVFEAAFNLKAASQETAQKKLEAEAQMHNAKADDAQSMKQGMSDTISTIISTLRDIKRDIHDLNMAINKLA